MSTGLTKQLEKPDSTPSAAPVDVIGMLHFCQSQSDFEIARDIVTLMRTMKRGDKLAIEIECTGGHYDWRCSGDNQPCGPSEAARAMREGYDSVFGSTEQWNKS